MSRAVGVRQDPEAAVLDDLRRAAGEEAVLPLDHVHRFNVAGVPPRAVVAPDSTEAAARTLALCSTHGWPVEPAGAGTWLRAGAPPAVPPVVVTTERLRHIREYEPANLVVGVDAGAPMASLAAELAGQRQLVPLDPPAARGATIGAAVALGSAGPLRAGHGTPRDMVLGVEVVAGDGRVLHFGGRVVKNVAGYDLVRLLTGSRGAFGLLTFLFVRLRAAPELDVTIAVSAAGADEALEYAREIRSRMSPDALEVVGPALSARVLPGGAAAWTVLVRLRGTDAGVGEAAGRLAQIAGPRAVSLEAEAAHDAWQASGSAEAEAPLCVRLADLPSRLPHTVAAALRLTSGNSASGNASEWMVAVHAADGIVRVWPSAASDADALARLATALPPAVAELARTGGTVTWPVWPGTVGAPPPALPRPAADVWLRLVAELKAKFDPAGILSPGRHVAGI